MIILGLKKKEILCLFSRIILEKFALRLKNNIDNPDPQEIDNIRKLLRLDHNQTEIPLKQVKKKKKIFGN